MRIKTVIPLLSVRFISAPLPKKMGNNSLIAEEPRDCAVISGVLPSSRGDVQVFQLFLKTAIFCSVSKSLPSLLAITAQ